MARALIVSPWKTPTSSFLQTASPLQLFLRRRFPGIGIHRCLWVDAEIPHIKIHLLRIQHLHDGVFSCSKILLRHQFDPLACSKLGDVGWEEGVLLGDLAAQAYFHIANCSPVFLYLNPHQTKAIVQRSIVLRAFVDVDVNRGTRCVRLNLRVFALDLECLLGRKWIDGGTKNALLGILV